MCHLYDIDDNTAIKHSSFKHDSVQDAIATANAECDDPICWESEKGITQGFIDNEMVYEIVE
jgi:hypothetical protein